MASISPIGSFSIPAAQPVRQKTERSIAATEQVKSTSEKKPSPVVAQSDDKNSASSRPAPQRVNEEQQKIEAAQQEAQRADFDQQAGNVRNTEPNDVRPPSTQTSEPSQFGSLVPKKVESKNIESERIENNRVQRETASANQPAIDAFNQFQNINAAPRQGQELNQFV